MRTALAVLTLLIAAEHVWFLVLEMFLWTKPLGRAAFRTTADFAAQSAALAANQGLYNGFLAAGLVWGVLHPDPGVSLQIQLFFLACVFVAGLYGAFSVSRRILFMQAVPALVGLSVAWLIWRVGPPA